MSVMTYREMADAERAAAMAAALPMVRDRHLRSAEGWERMAEREEATAEARSKNLQARQEGE